MDRIKNNAETSYQIFLAMDLEHAAKALVTDTRTPRLLQLRKKLRRTRYWARFARKYELPT